MAVCLLVSGRAGLAPANAITLPQKLLRWEWHSELWFLFGLPLFVLVIKSDLWTARLKPGWRIAALATAVVIGAGFLTFRILALDLPLDFPGRWQYQVGLFLRGLALGSLMAAILYFMRREGDTRRELHAVQVAQADSLRRASESRLQALRAQIEPHFLFNSLASIKRLYERDPSNARTMLGNLVSYVKVATARAGQPHSRLADEIALAKAYLDMFHMRMGSRLHVSIDVPADLGEALVPPLAIGTLVENAIKHGISPRASGGSVALSARLDGQRLVVDVRDDGVGFRARSGHGIGLATVRAQLEAMFQGAASLELLANEGSGVTASLCVPCRFDAP